MALSEGHRANFQTLLRAAAAGDLALMEGTDKATGELRAMLVAANREEGGAVTFVPFGHLSNGNPFEEYDPPSVT